MLMRKISLPTILISTILFSSVTAQETFRGKTVSIKDGDTIEVLRDGKAVLIRLNGIDCPESHQAFGNKAKQFTSDLTFDKEVVVRSTGNDKYGRILGEIILPDGRILNRELVREGYAWWYREYSDDDDIDLQDLETQAKTEKKGLWADSNPTAPWDFRRGADVKTEKPSVNKDSQSETATVYVTRTGKKYHSNGCRYLSKSKIPMSLSDAISRGYTPCSVCSPPKLHSGESDANQSPSAIVQPKSQSGRCQAITKKGTQCKRNAKPGSRYCWQHGS